MTLPACSQIGAVHFGMKVGVSINEWVKYNEAIDSFKAARLPMSLLVPESHLNKVRSPTGAPEAAGSAQHARSRQPRYPDRLCCKFQIRSTGHVAGSHGVLCLRPGLAHTLARAASGCLHMQTGRSVLSSGLLVATHSSRLFCACRTCTASAGAVSMCGARDACLRSSLRGTGLAGAAVPSALI